MQRRTRRRLAAAEAIAFFALVGYSAVGLSTPDPDPLASSIARLRTLVDAPGEVDAGTKQVREASAPRIADAERALAGGRRWVALSRLALVWGDLQAVEYGDALPQEARGQMATLESEWARLGPELTASGTAATAPDLAALPAAARALAEAALAQVPVYYEASLDYGRNTAPEYGLFYLGEALAQRDLARAISTLPALPANRKAIAPRALGFEIAAAESELAAAYRPPLSLDAHPTFIRIGSILKEARELDESGARFGALQRLLDARARIARLTHPARTMSGAEAERRGREIGERLAASATDSSLEQLLLETALFSATDPETAAAGGGEVAAAIFEDVLPLFPGFLGPAPPRPPEPKAEATVTLVRWPYT
jgi:hypothetical protein